MNRVDGAAQVQVADHYQPALDAFLEQGAAQRHKHGQTGRVAALGSVEGPELD
jgi:hypothetical protein